MTSIRLTNTSTIVLTRVQLKKKAGVNITDVLLQVSFRFAFVFAVRNRAQKLRFFTTFEFLVGL